MRRIVDYPRADQHGVRRFLPSWKLVLGTGLAVFLLGVIAFTVLYSMVSVPDPNKKVTANASMVFWSDGKTPMGRLGDINRRSIPIGQMPDSLQKAVIAAEDRSFYDNMGISPKGIGRALWVKIKGGAKQGGSTITQQYVKNYFLTQDRTVTRKAKELVITLKIEQVESKDVILQNYLNTIYFGRGAEGVEAASQVWFGHGASTLTPSESILLASILRSPGLYDPIEHRDRVEGRMAYVVAGMVEHGWLSQADAAKVSYPKIIKRPTTNRLGGTTGYLLRAVRQEVITKTGLTDADIDRGGLTIVSTFSRKAQEAAVAAIKDEMPTTGTKGVGAGLIAIKPGDGAVTAMYGGKDAVRRDYNDATQARVPAASTFKPFTLVAALQDGVSLRSRYDGRSPQTFDGDYRVSNFGNRSMGYIDLVTATANSVNTVYVALNEQVGPERTRDVAISAGYPKDTQDLTSFMSNVLGPAAPHVIDVANAYATFAAQGERSTPYMVRSVKLADGSLGYKARPQVKRAFDQGVMADLTYALQSVVERGSGSHARSLDRPVAGKTGTSQDNKSAWFAGYTPQLAVAVGLHRTGPDGGQLSLRGLGGVSEVTGATFPVRIWTAFMQGALKGERAEDFPQPVYGGESNIPQNTAPATTDPSTSSTPTMPGTPTTPTDEPTQTKTATPTEPSTPTLPTVPEPTSSPAGRPGTQESPR